MLNTCWNCGLYRADKVIDPAGPNAVCPECGHKHPFRQLPLLIVAGASGTGKSTVCQQLLGTLDEVVLLDVDILWQPAFNQPENQYRNFFETWLRMAKNIGQSGRPVVLFGAGLGVPDNIEPCIERRYFSEVHYLALACAEETLRQRLQDRPAWRESGQAEFIERQIQFNQWFEERGRDVPHPVDLLDTTNGSVQETASQVTDWIYGKIKPTSVPGLSFLRQAQDRSEESATKNPVYLA